MRLPAVLLPAAALVVAAGCMGGSGGGSPTPPPGPACYTLSPPDCRFSRDVMGVSGQPEPANPSVTCYESGCHTGPSPGGLLLLGPPGIYPVSQIWYLLINSGGSIQRAGGGREVVVSTNAAIAATSLLLSKCDADSPSVSHGGGKIFSEASPQYKTILSWIMSGAQDN